MADTTHESRIVISGDPSSGVRAWGAVAVAADAASTKMRGAMGGIAGSFTSLHAQATGLFATLAGAGFIAATRRQIDYMDATRKAAQAAGVSTEVHSELAYAAKLADLESETLTKTLAKLSGMMLDVARGDEKVTHLFEQTLKVKVRDANGAMRETDQVLMDLAQRFAVMDDGPKKTAIAIEAFGEKLGPRLIPFLNSGREGIQQLREEARKLGIVVSEEAGARAEQLNDNITRLGSAAQGTAHLIAETLLPKLAGISEWFLQVAKDEGVARAALIGFGRVVANATGQDEESKARAAHAQAQRYTLDAERQLAQARERLRSRPDSANAQADVARITGQLAVSRERERQAYQAVANAMFADSTGDGRSDRSRVIRFPKADPTGALSSKAGNTGTTPKPASRVPEFEAVLASQALVHQQAMQAQQSFHQFGKQEEANYWKGILATQQLTTVERDAIQRKLLAAERDTMKGRYEAEQADLKLRLDAAVNDYNERDRLAQQAAALAGERFGVSSKEYTDALRQQQDIARDHQARLAEISRLRADSERADQLLDIDLRERQAEFEAQLGLRSQNDLLQVRRVGAQQRLDIELAALDAEQLAWGDSTVEYAQFEQRKAEARRRFREVAGQIGRDQAGKDAGPGARALGGVDDGFQRSLDALVEKGRSASADLRQIWTDTGNTFIREMVTRPIAEWMAGQARKLILNAGFLTAKNAQEVASGAITKTTEGSTGLVSIGVQAARAAAATYASIAQIPIVGPFLAPVAAATALGAVMSFGKRIFSAEGGFDIPNGVNPMVQAHAREMILPARLADVIRGMAGQGIAAPAAAAAGMPLRVVPMPGDFWMVHRQDLLRATDRASRDKLRR